MDNSNEKVIDEAYAAVIKSLFVILHRQYSEAANEAEKTRAENAFKNGATNARACRERALELMPNFTIGSVTGD